MFHGYAVEGRFSVKSEIRISKSETKAKPECLNDRKNLPSGAYGAERCASRFGAFGFWSFDIVSSFGFRAWDL
jgi:hypothetical protein